MVFKLPSVACAAYPLEYLPDCIASLYNARLPFVSVENDIYFSKAWGGGSLARLLGLAAFYIKKLCSGIEILSATSMSLCNPSNIPSRN